MFNVREVAWFEDFFLVPRKDAYWPGSALLKLIHILFVMTFTEK